MRRDRRRAANNNLRSAVQVISCPNCKEPVLPSPGVQQLRPVRGREVVATK
jgi:large subunit ribosomal protein L32